MNFENLPDKIKSKIESYKDEILGCDITQENINNREQNFLYIADKITDSTYNEFGSESLYYDLLYYDMNRIKYEKLEEDEFNSIWWTLLDIVESYIQCVIEGEL